MGNAKSFVASRPDWIIGRFSNLSMTNFLYLLGAYLWVRTSEHYMRTPGWQPSIEWLAGIGAVVGGGITQWVKKRTTNHEYQRIQNQGAVSEDGSARAD